MFTWLHDDCDLGGVLLSRWVRHSQLEGVISLLHGRELQDRCPNTLQSTKKMPLSAMTLLSWGKTETWALMKWLTLHISHLHLHHLVFALGAEGPLVGQVVMVIRAFVAVQGDGVAWQLDDLDWKKIGKISYYLSANTDMFTWLHIYKIENNCDLGH